MYTVYTKNGCGFCDMLKMLLESKDIEFTAINIDDDEESKQFVIQEGHRSVPQIYKDGKLFVEGGFQGMKKYLSEQDTLNNLGSI